MALVHVIWREIVRDDSPKAASVNQARRSPVVSSRTGADIRHDPDIASRVADPRAECLPMDPAFMPVSSDVDTRTFAEWLVDYAADGQAVVNLTDRDAESAEDLAYRRGLRDAALEILERHEQAW